MLRERLLKREPALAAVVLVAAASLFLGCCDKTKGSSQASLSRFLPSGGSNATTWLGRCVGSDPLTYRVVLTSNNTGKGFEASRVSPGQAKPSEPPRGAWELLDHESPNVIQLSDLVAAPFLRCTLSPGSKRVADAALDVSHLSCTPTAEESSLSLFGSCKSTEFFLASDLTASGIKTK